MQYSRIPAKKLALAMAISATCPAIFANDTDSTDHIESVVVVGSATNAVIEMEDLADYQANDLADVFRQVPSVSVGGGSLGLVQKIYIRGMEDTLLNITVDGAPQTSTLFHHIGRLSIEPELLKEVAVQAGAGEATSGAGAIGGAVRFKTVTPDDLLEDGATFGAIVKGSYFSNSGEKFSASAYGKLNEDWGLLGSIVIVDRDNTQDGNGDDIHGTSAEQTLGFIKLNGQLSDSQAVSLSYEKRKESGEFNQRPNWPAYEDSTLFPLDAERETIVANYQLNLSDAIDLEFTAYNTQASILQNVFTRWGKYSGEVSSSGFDLRNTSQLGSHNLVYGIDARIDKSVGKPVPDDNNARTLEEGYVGGAYVQDHWQINSPLTLSLGARFDSYDVGQKTLGGQAHDTGISPNIGIAYDVTDRLQLTAGHAQAMRGQLVGDTFTVEASYLDPSLKAETVKNNEIGAEYTGANWYLKAAAYQSTIDDVIYDQQGRGTHYENIGELETHGGELVAAYQFSHLRLEASYNNTDTELNGHDVEGYEHNGLGNSRGDTYTFSIDYAPLDQISMGWFTTYVKSLNNIEVLHRSQDIGWIDSLQYVDKNPYVVHDMYVRLSPLSSGALSLDLSVQNVFDKAYRDHSSTADYNHIAGWEGVVGLNESGRDIRLSASYQF